MEVSVCSYTYTLSASWLIVNRKATNSLKNSEKFLLGCQAVAGIPVAEISSASQISREYIYQQKDMVLDFIHSLDNTSYDSCLIAVDDRLITRLVLSLSLDCHASIEGIQRSAQAILGQHISIGKISSIIREASERAQQFDDQITLETIKQGANDEIFQGNVPVLTGIDPESTYIYLLEEAGDRTADTWELFMEDRKDHGLNLEVNISDAGTGLTRGIPRAFPEIQMQMDVFHALRCLGTEIVKIERKAYALIEHEAELEERARGKRPWKKTLASLEEIRPKVNSAIERYDQIYILFLWLQELLTFSGYDRFQTQALIHYVLEEMEKAAAGRNQLSVQIEKFRKSLPQLLCFLNRMEDSFERSVREKGIPPDSLRLMYRQKAVLPSEAEYGQIEISLAKLLGKDYDRTRREFEDILSQTKKASSLVENLNGRIRSYMDLKRTVPKDYFVLLKVYFNTRKYRRSRIASRIGKSPIELMTGKQYPEFLEALGY